MRSGFFGVNSVQADGKYLPREGTQAKPQIVFKGVAMARARAKRKRANEKIGSETPEIEKRLRKKSRG